MPIPPLTPTVEGLAALGGSVARGIGGAAKGLGEALGGLNSHLLEDVPAGGIAGAAGGAGLLGADVGWPLARDFGERFLGSPLTREVENRWAQVRAMGNPVHKQWERQRLLAAMEANHEALAQMSPHLYAEILAGTRLPIGAVVIGGQPDSGLLEQVLGSMSGDGGPTPTGL